MDLVEINSPDDLESWQLPWQALAASMPQTTFFHTFDWFRIFWKQAADRAHVQALAVRSAVGLVGIIPLVAPRKSAGGAETAVHFPTVPWTSWFSAIGREQAAAFSVAMAHLAEKTRRRRPLDFGPVAGAADANCRLTAALQRAGWQPRRCPQRTLSRVELVGSWDDYQRRWTPMWRDEVRWARRALAALGPVRLDRHCPRPAAQGDGDPRWDLWEDCVALARAAATGRCSAERPLSGQNLPWSRACHAAAARLGMLDVSVLRLGKRPAAFCYGYRSGGAVEIAQIGYDPAVARWGLGRLVASEVIRDSFERGDASLDLGPGDFRFQRELRTSTATRYRVRCGGAGWRHWLGRKFSRGQDV
jgi:hypothetical protein